jgi:hypothetical protein
VIAPTLAEQRPYRPKREQHQAGAARYPRCPHRTPGQGDQTGGQDARDCERLPDDSLESVLHPHERMLRSQHGSRRRLRRLRSARVQPGCRPHRSTPTRWSVAARSGLAGLTGITLNTDQTSRRANGKDYCPGPRDSRQPAYSSSLRRAQRVIKLKEADQEQWLGCSKSISTPNNAN